MMILLLLSLLLLLLLSFLLPLLMMITVYLDYPSENFFFAKRNLKFVFSRKASKYPDSRSPQRKKTEPFINFFMVKEMLS